MSSPMGERKYHKLVSLALLLLSIPSSNAESERVFCLVRTIKTNFRLTTLLTDTFDWPSLLQNSELFQEDSTRRVSNVIRSY